EHCYRCHSADAAKEKKLKGNLYLDTRAGALTGGENGPAIVPGKPNESRLIQAVRYVDEDLRMPPKKQLPPEAVAVLEKWVAMGAPDPRSGEAAPVAGAAKKGIDLEAGRQFWCFRPLAAIAPPELDDDGWARTPVDRFVLSKL